MQGKRVWLAIAVAAILLLAGCIGEKENENPGREEDDGDDDRDPIDDEELTLEEVQSLGESSIKGVVENLSAGGGVDLIQGSFTDPENPVVGSGMPETLGFWARFGADGGSRQQLDAMPYFQLTIYCFADGMIYELDGDYDPDDLDGVPGPGAYEARSPDEACDTEEFYGDGFWRNGFMIKGDRFGQSEAEDMTFRDNRTDSETGHLVVEYDEVDWRGEAVGNLTAWIDLEELRLTALSAQYDDGIKVAFDVEYGDRVTLGRPSIDTVRLPTEVRGYEEHDHNYHYYIDHPDGQGIPLDEFEVRFFDPASPQDYVAFDPAGPPEQNEEDWYFTYYDEDGDGTMNAGDHFQVEPEWNYMYGGESYPYEEYYEHTAVVWDLWADAPVTTSAPGPGVVVFLVLALLGGLFVRRRGGA